METSLKDGDEVRRLHAYIRTCVAFTETRLI